jgi:tetratricopeptide (TPR) repeat protein
MDIKKSENKMKTKILHTIILLVLSTSPCFGLDNFFIKTNTKCNQEFIKLLQDAYDNDEVVKISDWDNKKNACELLDEFNLYKAMLFQINNEIDENDELIQFIIHKGQNTKDSKMIMLLGYACIRFNGMKNAEKIAKHLVDKLPSAPYGYKLWGAIYHHYGEYNKAMDYYIKAYELCCCEDDMHIIAAMAETYYALKNYKQSALCMLLLLANRPVFSLYQNDEYKLNIIESFLEERYLNPAMKLISSISEDKLDEKLLNKYKLLKELYERSVSEIY